MSAPAPQEDWHADLVQVEVQRAAERFESRRPGVESRHSFSFGRHYDPSNVSFGLLLAVNEERLAAGAGFGPHPHAGVEIVTWVLSGELHHDDSAGGTGIVRPGLVQRLYAGSGVTHREQAAAAGPVRLVQMWLATDPPAGPPEYEMGRIDRLSPGILQPVAAPGAGPAAVRLRQPAATLHLADLEPGVAVALPDAPFLHVQVTAGQVRLADRDLAEMDTARITDAVQLAACAGAGGGSILVWQLQPAPQPAHPAG